VNMAAIGVTTGGEEGKHEHDDDNEDEEEEDADAAGVDNTEE
jgi:hypothetical protein